MSSHVGASSEKTHVQERSRKYPATPESLAVAVGQGWAEPWMVDLFWDSIRGLFCRYIGRHWHSDTSAEYHDVLHDLCAHVWSKLPLYHPYPPKIQKQGEEPKRILFSTWVCNVIWRRLGHLRFHRQRHKRMHRLVNPTPVTSGECDISTARMAYENFDKGYTTRPIRVFKKKKKSKEWPCFGNCDDPAHPECVKCRLSEACSARYDGVDEENEHRFVSYYGRTHDDAVRSHFYIDFRETLRELIDTYPKHKVEIVALFGDPDAERYELPGHYESFRKLSGETTLRQARAAIRELIAGKPCERESITQRYGDPDDPCFAVPEHFGNLRAMVRELGKKVGRKISVPPSRLRSVFHNKALPFLQKKLGAEWF